MWPEQRLQNREMHAMHLFVSMFTCKIQFLYFKRLLKEYDFFNIVSLFCIIFNLIVFIIQLLQYK